MTELSRVTLASAGLSCTRDAERINSGFHSLRCRNDACVALCICLCLFVVLCRNLGLYESDLQQTRSSLYVLGGSGRVALGSSPLCARLGGLSPGQRRFCQLYEDHMLSVASGVRLAVTECQRQFRFRRWNCSTARQHTGNTNVTSSLFGHVTDIGQCYVRGSVKKF